jgi:hypothetical protein
MASSDFEVQVMDDPDHEDLIAEILYKGEFCFLISQEAGFQSLEIQVQSRQSGVPWRFSMAEMEDAIERAKKRLWELRRVEG